MTPKPPRYDEEAARQLAREEDLADLAFEAEGRRLSDLVELLASVLMARRIGGPLILPDFDVFADETLQWLALRDPLFFSAACEAEAAYCEDAASNQWPVGKLDFVAKLLRALHSPNRRRSSGDNLARDLLILATMDALAEIGAGRASDPDPFGWESGLSLAEALADRLNATGYLSKNPDAVPDASRLREIWAKRANFLKRAKPPTELSGIGISWLD